MQSQSASTIGVVGRIALLLLAALVAAPLAFASRVGPEPYRRPHVPLQWEQHRAVAQAAARGEPVYCGAGRSNAVALTFDDGPGPLTGELLDTLRAAGAHATFFLVGTASPNGRTSRGPRPSSGSSATTRGRTRG